MINRLKDLVLLGAILGLSIAPVCGAEELNISSDTPIANLIASAKAARARGSTNDALAYFDAAIARDSSDYLTFFQRGATYLSAGRNSQAKSDFDKVLKIKPDFEGALLQRAKIEARNGDWDAAKHDYRAAGAKGSEGLAEIETAQGAAYIAVESEQKKEWASCVENAGVAIMAATGAISLRQLRARCRLEMGDVEMAISDLNYVSQLNPSLLHPYLQMSSMLFYSLGDTEKALLEIKRCLHSDPESKPCKTLFREEKTLLKSFNNVDELVSKRKFNAAARELTGSTAETAPGILSTIKANTNSHIKSNYIHPSAPSALYTTYLDRACEAYLGMNNHQRAQPYCTELLTLSPHSLHGLLHSAQAHIDNANYDAAIAALNTAREHHPSAAQEIQSKLSEAHRLLKVSKQKDYYKVLDVSRSASERDIKKAYRTLTKQHHPDKAMSRGVSKEEAERKMASINEAYEVLSDPELKQRYDNGDDPNDPMSRQGGNPFEGGTPFGFPGGGSQQFFFQQGGGGGGQRTFKFSTGGGGGGGGGGNPFGGMPFGGFPGFG